MPNDTSTTTESQGDSSSSPAQGATSTSQGEQSTPTDIEALKQKIAELERDNRKYRTDRKQQEEAAQAAEQERKAKQGEFEKLYEEHKAKVKELEPKAQELAELAELFTKQVQEQMKDWPQEVKNFYPGDDAPIKQRLDWLDKSRALVERLTQQRPSSPGNRPNPPAVGSVNQSNQDTLKKELQRVINYGGTL